MGPIFGSPYNKSPTILGYTSGPLIFGVSHIVHGLMQEFKHQHCDSDSWSLSVEASGLLEKPHRP